MIKEILNISLKGHYPYQKLNYAKHLLFSKKPVLGYKPVVISIVSTSNCTLSCDMCPTHSKIVPKDYRWRQTAAKDMNFGLFKRILDLFREALSVHIIGSGEPMLNKDFFKMVEYASRDRRMEVKSFTNGTTIRENMENLLNSELDGLTVSINGHNEEEFSRMTGMPQEIFKKIYDDTRELIDRKNRKKKKIKVKLSFIIDKINYKRLPEMVELAKGLKADHTFFCNFLPCLYEGLAPQKRVIMKDDRRIAEFIKDIKTGMPHDIRKKFSFPLAIDPKSAKNRCDVHFKQIRIDGDGNVSSCSMMLLNMEGTGRIDDKDCWNSAFLVNMRKKFIQNEDLEELCLWCPGNKGIEV